MVWLLRGGVNFLVGPAGPIDESALAWSDVTSFLAFSSPFFFYSRCHQQHNVHHQLLQRFCD